MTRVEVVRGEALPQRSDEDWWRRPPAVKCAYMERPHGLLHYRTVRPATPQRPPVLILHQSASSGRCYEHLAAAIGEDRTVVVPDTPGFGASDPLPQPPLIEDLAKVAAGVIEELGLGSVDVFGDHTGTKTAVELAVTRPDLIRRVVLHAPAVFNEQELLALRTRDSAIHSPNADGSHVMMRWNWRRENLACAPIVLREMEMVEALRSGPFAEHGHHAALQYDMAGNLQKVRQKVCILRLRDLWEQVGRTQDLVRDGVMFELPDFGRESLTMRHRQLATITKDFLDAP